MTTYSNLKYDHSFSSNATGTGGLTKISSQTASSSSSLSFTTGIDSSYKEYVFKFINIHPASDNVNFQFNLSADGGSNYNVTKTTTTFFGNGTESGSGAQLAYSTGGDLAQATGYQNLNDTGGNGNDEALSGTLNLFDPSNTTFVKHFISRTDVYWSSNGNIDWYVSGYGNTTSAVNAIDFKMSSGNIDSGTIIMYGVS